MLQRVGELDARADAELGVDVAQVRLDRARAEDELLGGLAHFTVKYGTGSYGGARGSGLASFSEDAADHDRITLIGRISR
jgi:hypothetical protein